MSNDAPHMRDGYCIAFDTKTMPGKVLVTRVVLREEIVDAAEFETARWRIDLIRHPLFSRLAQYVWNNTKPKEGTSNDR